MFCAAIEIAPKFLAAAMQTQKTKFKNSYENVWRVHVHDCFAVQYTSAKVQNPFTWLEASNRAVQEGRGPEVMIAHRCTGGGIRS